MPSLVDHWFVLCLINNMVCFFPQTLARVLFPGTPHQHSSPVLESSQSGSSHSFSSAVEPLCPTSFHGLSALITCCRPSTPLAQRNFATLDNPQLEEEEGGTVSSGRATPCSQELFESPLATTSAPGEDDPVVDNAGMSLKIV